MSASVEVQGLSVEYGDRRVLDGVNLAVAAGEWVGIVGPNGAGKTTLLRSVAGLTSHAGDIRVGDLAVNGASRRQAARRVALVPQSPHVPAGMTVLDYILLGRNPHLGYLEVEGARDLAAAADVLIELDMTPFGVRRLDSLSGGELQRTVLARALVQEAPVLLLDEPTTALDLGRTQLVLELVDGLRRTNAVTVLSSMHDLTAAAQFVDRVVFLADGVIVAEGKPAEVFTAELIAQHYGATVRIIDDGEGGIAVLPRRQRAPATG